MTEPRRRIPAGRRDAERLLDGHGRRPARPAGHGTDPRSPEDPAALLAALLADAAASPRRLDTTREHEVLQHFRAATRHAAPLQRSVRQRVAALSATAKVLSVAVGATATGGVALASASVPLGDGLRPFTSQTSDAPAGRGGSEPTATPGSPTAAGTATTVREPGSGGPAGDGGDSPRQDDRGSWRGAFPAPAPTGFPPGVRNPATTPTESATTPPTTGPTTEPTFDFSLPPEEPTTDPPISRAPPDFEEPPPDDAEPTPTEDVGNGHPDPDPTATRTSPE
jgi:hypothetical protein